MKLLLVTAGVGTPSSTKLLGERLADASVAALAARGADEVEVQHVELRTLAIALAEHSATRVASAELEQVLESVREADGVIAVTPVFNGSYTGIFKLFFDAVDADVMAGRPVLLGATGGTARHSFVIDHTLVPLFFYLKAVIAPLGVFAATEDWGDSSRLESRIARAADAFSRCVLAATPDKKDHSFDVVDFTDLLR